MYFDVGKCCHLLKKKKKILLASIKVAQDLCFSVNILAAFPEKEVSLKLLVSVPLTIISRMLLVY